MSTKLFVMYPVEFRLRRTPATRGIQQGVNEMTSGINCLWIRECEKILPPTSGYSSGNWRKIHDALWLGRVRVLGMQWHPLSLMFLASGGAMISSRLRIPKP
jgi:hypothetical protein